jgi:RHS repeat-associated protein
VLTDRNGRRRAFDYDQAGRFTAERWLDGNGNTIRTESYGYSAANELVSASDPDSAYSFTFDVNGYLVNVNNAGTPHVPQVSLTFAYEPLGHRISMTDNLGGAMSYGYDAAARLTALSLQVGPVSSAQASFQCDDANRLTNVSRQASFMMGSPVATALTYDNDNRLTQIIHSAGAQNLATFSYTLDAANQLTDYTGPEGTLHFAYDLAAELIDVTGARTEHYQYDLNGNRIGSGYVIGMGNHLLSDGTYNYTWDNEGNLLTKTRISDGQKWEYTWDYRNRLTKVVVKNSQGAILSQQDSTFDVFNRRIGVVNTVSGVTTQTWTVYDGVNPYIDFNASGAVTGRYLYTLGGQLIGKMTTNFATWYLTDMPGSVRLVVGPGGGVLDQITYDSFGQILSESMPGNGDRFKFAGGQWDSVAGHYQMGARAYAPSSGTFSSEDPTGFGGGDPNLFRYANNTPTTLVDPSGLDSRGAWDHIMDLANGVNDVVTDGVMAGWNAINHPIDTAENVVRGTQEFIMATGNGVIALGEDVINGDFANLKRGAGTIAQGMQVISQRPLYYSGRVVGYVFLNAAGSVVGRSLLGCFPAGTQVATEHGPVAIETLRSGDRVWGYDIKHDEWSLRNVSERYKHDYEGPMVAVTLGNVTFEATGNHPFWVVSGEGLEQRETGPDVPEPPTDARTPGRWVKAESLREGDVLLLKGNRLAPVTGLASRFAREEVYNLQVESVHTYAVGPMAALVHNKPHILDRTGGPPKSGSCTKLFKRCFPAGTLVGTIRGLRPIEKIEAGEDVWAFDIATAKWRSCKVLQTISERHECETVFVTVAGEMIHATAGHPFWVVRGKHLAARPLLNYIQDVPADAEMPGRWVEARDLNMGDELLLRDGRIVPIEALRVEAFDDLVYNFEVAELHCYTVGRNNVLVHNNCPCPAEAPRVTKKIPRDKLKAKPKERGRAPIGEDNKPVELHHTDQTQGNASPRVEMTQEQHRGKGNYKRNHSNTGQEASTVDRAESSAQHRAYWENQWDNGAFDNLPGQE